MDEMTAYRQAHIEYHKTSLAYSEALGRYQAAAVRLAQGLLRGVSGDVLAAMTAARDVALADEARFRAEVLEKERVLRAAQTALERMSGPPAWLAEEN